jgi:hypothetical protein
MKKEKKRRKQNKNRKGPPELFWPSSAGSPRPTRTYPESAPPSLLSVADSGPRSLVVFNPWLRFTCNHLRTIHSPHSLRAPNGHSAPTPLKPESPSPLSLFSPARFAARVTEFPTGSRKNSHSSSSIPMSHRYPAPSLWSDSLSHALVQLLKLAFLRIS